MIVTKAILTICVWAVSCTMMAQDARSELQNDVHRAAGIYYALPTADTVPQTPPPPGMKPFYISHYSCTAPHYLEPSKTYEEPLATLAHADSLGKLTPLGRDVLERLRRLSENAYLRTGELTASGIQLTRQQAQQMANAFPEVLCENSIIDGRSIVLNRSIFTLQEAMLQLARLTRYKSINPKVSHKNDIWMNPEDKELEEQRTNAQVLASYGKFKAANTDNSHLMQVLFNDDSYVNQHIHADQLADQLFLLAGNMPHTDLAPSTTLFDIFTPQEIYRHWRVRNAWNYICYGGYTLNGGYQPYSQRVPLWNLLHMGDSINMLSTPVTHLRYTTPTMLLSLASLMELDSLGLQTDCLETIEDRGWKDYAIAPLAGNIQIIHYRNGGQNSSEMVIKVLFNGHEARLPINTDCPPYYRWKDVKRYYLRKLYTYEKLRFQDKKK